MESCQYVGINVIVNENYSCGGYSYEFLKKCIGIEHLLIKEYSHFDFEGAIIKFVKNFVYAYIGIFYLLTCFYSELLEGFQTLKHSGMSHDVTAHGHKGSNYSD